MDDYFELKIKINPEIADVVSDFCFENFQCEGVILAEETYKDDLVLVSTTEGTLEVYLKSIDNLEEKLKEERNLLKQRGLTDEELGSWEISISKIENEDWSKKWKENWDITPISDKLTIVPSWIDYQPKQDEITITLDPGMAFGTGTHATTQLCMKAIEKYLKPNDTVADIGTGSGILAICGIKFGAKSAYGCDNDESVIQTAIDNAKKNDVINECKFEFKTADKMNKKYDFIAANILHNILAEIMGDLKALMKDNAYLSLSGILDEKKDIVLEAIKQNGLKVIEEDHIDIWTGFVVSK